MVDSIGMFKQKHGKGDKDEENDKNITKQKDVSSFDWYDQAKARATLLAAARKEPERGNFLHSIRIFSSIRARKYFLLLLTQITQLPLDYFWTTLLNN